MPGEGHAVRLLLFDEDIELIDAGGIALIHQNDYSRGIRLRLLCDRIRSQVGFKCSAEDIDESGGLAELYDLNGYSKRVNP